MVQLLDVNQYMLNDNPTSLPTDPPPTAPPTTPDSSMEEQLKDIRLEREDSLSDVPPLPEDSSITSPNNTIDVPQLPTDSPEDSSIDQSEDTSYGHTVGDCTEDEATSPEEQTDRPKHYSKTDKMGRPSVDNDTE